MKLLGEITEKDIGISQPSGGEVKYKLRKAARAVVFDQTGRIALMNVSKRGYHKLPGGGVEAEEDVAEALRREVLEETGCEIRIMEPVGMTIEYRNARELLQLSFCFHGEMVGQPGELSLTELEAENGFRLEWVTLEEARKLLAADAPAEYHEKFMVARDRILLAAAKPWSELG